MGSTRDHKLPNTCIVLDVSPSASNSRFLQAAFHVESSCAQGLAYSWFVPYTLCYYFLFGKKGGGTRDIRSQLRAWTWCPASKWLLYLCFSSGKSGLRQQGVRTAQGSKVCTQDCSLLGCFSSVVVLSSVSYLYFFLWECERIRLKPGELSWLRQIKWT